MYEKGLKFENINLLYLTSPIILTLTELDLTSSEDRIQTKMTIVGKNIENLA